MFEADVCFAEIDVLSPENCRGGRFLQTCIMPFECFRAQHPELVTRYKALINHFPLMCLQALGLPTPAKRMLAELEAPKEELKFKC